MAIKTTKHKTNTQNTKTIHKTQKQTKKEKKMFFSIYVFNLKSTKILQVLSKTKQ